MSLQSDTFFSCFKRQNNGSNEQNKNSTVRLPCFEPSHLYLPVVSSQGKLLNLNLSMVHFLHSQNEDDDISAS